MEVRILTNMICRRDSHDCSDSLIFQRIGTVQMQVVADFGQGRLGRADMPSSMSLSRSWEKDMPAAAAPVSVPEYGTDMRRKKLGGFRT